MQPLKGIKVVDLTTFLATPATGRVLGEWGADVIKVEAAKGDPTRVNQAVVYGMPSSDEENLAFDVANMHKRCISLNLKNEKGLEVMHKLLADADVFITNTRAKSLKKMGLDWETLHEKYPRLIMGHGLGYGKKGPEKDNAGFDVTCYMGRGGVFGNGARCVLLALLGLVRHGYRPSSSRKPVSGDDASPVSSTRPRPARYAARPASTAWPKARAIRRMSPAVATAVLAMTAVAPISMASHACDGRPIPASTITES